METLELTDDLINQFQGGKVTNEEIVAVYNPENAATMPEAFLQFMPHLTGEQIAALAKAYPNKPTGNSYLVLMDKTKKQGQLYPRSTWANLQSLRRVGGTAAQAIVPFTFSSRFNQKKAGTLTTSPVQDISRTESLPGITTSPVQQVQHNEATGAETGEDVGTLATLPAQQPTAGQQGSEGAANAIDGGSASGEFEEITIEQIQQDQQNQGGAVNTAESQGGATSAGAAISSESDNIKGAVKDAPTATLGTGTTAKPGGSGKVKTTGTNK